MLRRGTDAQSGGRRDGLMVSLAIILLLFVSFIGWRRLGAFYLEVDNVLEK